MLRLSKKTDYALLALRHLASDGASGVASARAIAERFNIPLELLAKILQQLARHGLIAAHQGVHGGYQLLRPSHAISVADVARVIDGPISLTACSPEDDRCDQFATCVVRHPLWLVGQRILSVLETVTIADLGRDERRLPLMVRKMDPEATLPVAIR
jgi:FeS assembly SUF system regulator